MQKIMTGKGINRLVIVTALASVLVACGKDEPAPTGITTIANAQESVATIGTGSLSVAEVRDYMSTRPVATGQKVTVDVVKKRVEEMVTGEVLFQEALRLKLDQQPELRRNLRQLLAQILLSEKVDKIVLSREISDEELKQYFEQHRLDYARPVQYRLADIFIAVDEGTNESERAKKLELAKDILAQAIARKGERFVYSQLVKNYSEKHPAYAIGDTGFFGLQGKPIGIESALTEAAFSLKRNGEIYEQVVETSIGYHIIMRVGRRAAIEKEYTDVRHDLDQRIRREQLEQKRRAYVDGIRNKADVQIDDTQISRLVTELDITTVQAVDSSASSGNINSSSPPTLSPEK